VAQTEGFDGVCVSVQKFDARTIPRAAAGRDLERRPRHHAAEAERHLFVGKRHPKLLIGLQNNRGHDLCPTIDKLTSVATVPSATTSTVPCIVERGARRVPR